ncbi:MAG: hypothetical protein ACOZD0_09595 [Pseudomonadota bacterium]
MATADQPLTVPIRPAGAVTALLVGVAAAAMASVLAWAASRPWGTPASQAAAGVAVALTALLAASALWRLRQPPLLLGWDGRQWWLARPSAGRESPHWSGELRLVWRLGSCWVLRGRGERADVWLTVDARPLGLQAHALLCALYCARRRPVI